MAVNLARFNVLACAEPIKLNVEDLPTSTHHACRYVCVCALVIVCVGVLTCMCMCTYVQMCAFVCVCE